MFYDCRLLTFLDVSRMDTSKVKDFRTVFYNCENLVSLNIYPILLLLL